MRKGEADAALILEAAMLDRIDSEAAAGARRRITATTSLARDDSSRAARGKASRPSRSSASSAGPTARSSEPKTPAGRRRSAAPPPRPCGRAPTQPRRSRSSKPRARATAPPSRQVEVDREIGHAELAQRLGREQHGLGIGGRARRADQLDARLAELPLGPRLAALHPQDLAGIGQPQRPGRVLQARGRDARDLRRHVGAQAHHALRHRVHQPEGLAGDIGAGGLQEPVLELDQRRLDPLVAARGEGGDQALDRRRLEARIGRQEIAQALRQESRIGRPVHGPSAVVGYAREGLPGLARLSQRRCHGRTAAAQARRYSTLSRASAAFFPPKARA